MKFCKMMDFNLIWKYRIENGGSVRHNCFDSEWEGEREGEEKGGEREDWGRRDHARIKKRREWEKRNRLNESMNLKWKKKITKKK